MENYQHKILSWLIVFSVILSLIFLCFVLIDLNDIWKDLTEHQERIKNLEILTLRRIGVKI
jgi:TM2 domain-containing membrane protein YozV